MLEKNLNAIKIVNPELEKKIREHQYNNVVPIQAQSGDISLQYNNINLHSDVDPIAEAEILLKSQVKSDLNNKNSFFIVFGLGLGYLFKRTYISTPGRIILLEPNLDILRFTLEYVDFSNEISDNRVFVCSSVFELIEILNKKYLIGDALELIFMDSYLQFNAEIINELSKRILSLVESKKVDQNTILNKSLMWSKGSFLNLESIKNALSVDVLEGIFIDKPVVIASAGPSLDENIDFLRTNRDKFVLLTVNTALRALISNDIIPDFCIMCEVGGVETHFEGLKGLDKINYILHPRTQTDCWKLTGKKNFVYYTDVDGFSQWFNKLSEGIFKHYPSAGNVSLLAFYVAFNVFKSQQVILIGQDLAFTNNQIYSSSALRDNFEIVDGKINFIPSKEKNNLEKTEIQVILENMKKEFFEKLELVTVKNYLGEEVLSRKDYYEFACQYEDIIKNEVPENVKVVNTSLKGFFIEGMSYEPFEKVLSNLESFEKPVNEVIDTIIKEKNSSLERNIKLVTPKITEFYKKINNTIPKCVSIIDLLKLILDDYSNNPQNIRIQDRIKDFYNRKTVIYQFIQSEEILFFMLQGDLYRLINSYITPSNDGFLSLEEHISNIKSELVLWQNVLEALQWIKEFIIEKQ